VESEGSMMGRRTKVRRWLVILVLLSAALWLAGCQAPDVEQWYEQARAWVVAKVASMEQQGTGPLVASGTIQADEIRLTSELGGRILKVAAAPGERVARGELLVQLDDTPLQVQLREAEAAVAVAEANLQQVRAGPLAAEVDAARAALAQARAACDGQEAAWQNAVQAVQNPQALEAQIADAQTQAKLAEQGAALAEAELAKQQLIRDQKPEGSAERDAAEWQVDAAEQKLEAARADREAAQALLDGLKAIRARPLGLIAQAHAAEGQYHVAEQAVAVAEARLTDLQAGPTDVQIAVAERALALEQAKRDAILAQQRRFRLTSPADGLILDQALRAGELAAPAAVILTIADLEQLKLAVYVPATEIGRVQLGQVVSATVDSYPGRTFAGRVSRIGEEPEYTPRNVTTREERVNTFYEVEVTLDNREGLLKPGMPADATF
jgi:HlyD family secretion protein